MPISERARHRAGDGRRNLCTTNLAAIRFNHVISQFYDRLVAAGKPKKVGIVACMRKLLTIVNAMTSFGRF